MWRQFQSHIGAIRIFSSSILGADLRAFQSHIGAIRIYNFRNYLLLLRRFQSHIGAIRISAKLVNSVLNLHFNPTLVQLEFSFSESLDLLVAEFQSHIGAIRILTNNHHNPEPAPISIPHWCN